MLPEFHSPITMLETHKIVLRARERYHLLFGIFIWLNDIRLKEEGVRIQKCYTNLIPPIRNGRGVSLDGDTGMRLVNKDIQKIGEINYTLSHRARSINDTCYGNNYMLRYKSLSWTKGIKSRAIRRGYKGAISLCPNC